MVLIIVTFVAGCILFVERVCALRVEKVVPYHLVDQVQQSVEENASHRGKAILKRNNSPMAPVLRALLEREEEGLEVLNAVGEAAGTQQAAILEKRVRWLGALAAITPLLGLLGTASGMFEVVVDVQATGSGSIDTMTPGLRESLSTTVAGLTLGALLFVGHRFAVRRLEQAVSAMEFAAAGVADACAIVRGQRDAVLERQRKAAASIHTKRLRAS